MSSYLLNLLDANEEARLLTLSQYDIRDFARDPIFAEFVTTTARIFKMPISLIGLVGATQVNYPAVQGLLCFTGLSREEAICDLVVQRKQAVVFSDLAQPTQLQHLTEAAQANVRAQQFRFYAGVPVRMPDQRVIGTFCLLDRAPRTLSLAELRVLEQLAALISRLLVVRHACLASGWLGEEPWNLVQTYLVSRFQELRVLTLRTGFANRRKKALAPAVLRRLVRHLNLIGTLLAEPLPGPGVDFSPPA